MNSQIYYSPLTTSAQNQSANGQGTQRSDTRVPTGHPSASTQAQQSQINRPRRRNQRSKADPDLVIKSWNLDDAQGLPSPVVVQKANTSSNSSSSSCNGTPHHRDISPDASTTANTTLEISSTQIGISQPERHSTHDFPPDHTSHSPHAAPSPKTLTGMEVPPQKTAPSYLQPLAIETATGVYLIPFTTDREEIAAFVENMHFILTPETERMLAALDLGPSRPADHVDTQPIQASSSTTSSKGKRTSKRERSETEKGGDESMRPKTKKMRLDTPRGAKVQGDVTATAEHRPEPEPLIDEPIERSSSSD